MRIETIQGNNKETERNVTLKLFTEKKTYIYDIGLPNRQMCVFSFFFFNHVNNLIFAPFQSVSLTTSPGLLAVI